MTRAYIIFVLVLLSSSLAITSCNKEPKCVCIKSYSDGRPDEEMPNYKLVDSAEAGSLPCGTTVIDYQDENGLLITISCGEQ